MRQKYIIICKINYGTNTLQYQACHVSSVWYVITKTNQFYPQRPQNNELVTIRSFLKKQESVNDDEKQPLDKPEE